MANKNIKILYVLNKCPYPLFDGTRERIFGEIKFLSTQYTLDVLIASTENINEDQLNHLKQIISGEIYIFKIGKVGAYTRSGLGLFSSKPIQVFYFLNLRVKRWFQKNAKKYNSIYFHTIRNGEYLATLKKRSLYPGTKLLLSFNDAISLNYQRAKEKATGIWKFIYKIEEKRVKNYELLMLETADGFSIVSTADKKYIEANWREVHPGKTVPNITVIQNGINDAYLKFNYTGLNKNLVFFGNLAYPPNHQGLENFTKTIWPKILEKMPKTRMIIIGRGGDEFKQNKNIDVLGFVDNPYQDMCQQAVLINPINFGAGVPTKVLLSMAIGLPVVAYGEGVSGIEGVKDQENIVLIDGASIPHTVEKICALLEDSNLRQKISEGGRSLILDKYTASSNYPDLSNFLVRDAFGLQQTH